MVLFGSQLTKVVRCRGKLNTLEINKIILHKYQIIFEFYRTIASIGTKKIAFDKGCYEVKNLNDCIKKEYGWEKGKEGVVITADPITLRTHLKIAKDWKVNFPEMNSVAKVLGFQNKDYVGPKEFIGEKICNILKVNNILVQCDVIAGSSINGKPAPVIFNYSPDVQAGSKIVAEPVTPIYLPVTLDSIQDFTVWVTDQDNELLDLQEEDLVITFHIRRR